MQPIGSATLIPSRRSRKVFISSVFSEPYGKPWELRDRLYCALREAGHTPWLYEREGERTKGHGESEKATILRGLEESEMVVVLYHTRAGSRLKTEPFYGTDFEVANAVRLGKRLKLYVLGHSYKPSLGAVLTVLADVRVFPEILAILETETEIVDRVVQDVDAIHEEQTRLYPAGLPVLSRSDCQRWHDRLTARTNSEDYVGAGDLAIAVPLDLVVEPEAKYSDVPPEMYGTSELE